MDIALSPNWTPLLLVVLLAVVCTLLYLAMRRQLRRLHANWSPASPSSPDTDDPTRQ